MKSNKLKAVKRIRENLLEISEVLSILENHGINENNYAVLSLLLQREDVKEELVHTILEGK